MNRSAKTLLAVGVALAVPFAACSDDKKQGRPAGPCERGTLTGCGESCSSSAPCKAGLFCDDGSCNAECSAGASDKAVSECSANESCSSEGRCVFDVNRADGGGLDGGASGDGGGELPESGSCGEVVLDTNPITPNVIFIIDQSSSMKERFGSGTRWEVLKTSLLADNGLIAELQDRVRFGVTLYSSKNGTMEGMACPLLTETTVALDNLAGIRAVYQPANYIDDTPTGDAINAVIDKWMTTVSPDEMPVPTIFVLATDGEPDTCAKPDGNNTNVDGRPQSLAAVKRAFEAGIQTYVIAVADERDLSQTHVDDLANAGVGHTGSPAAPSYRPDGDQGLRDALRAIVTGVVSCDVPLKGQVVASACEATVTLDGKAVPCTGNDGFELLPDSQVRLKGTACAGLKAGQVLSATFPCGGAIPVF